MSELPEKVCLLCGRRFTWRKKWERDWDNVRYCSDRCRRGKPGPDGEALEAAILALLDARPSAATICPSEAARVVRPEDWKELMEPARAAARRLTSRGWVEICQAGAAVDPSTARGPIRLRLTRQGRDRKHSCR